MTRRTETQRTNEDWLSDLRSEGARREAALEELRTVLVRGVSSAMSGRGVARELIEDAVQDGLLRILDKLESFRGDSRFTSWAMTIAVREVWTELRRHRYRDVSLEQLLGDGPVDSRAFLGTEPGADSDLERSRLVERVHDAIETDLTEKQRTALLAELAGMPQEEIARRMGSNRNALYKLVYDARKRLKRSLESAGYGAADIASAFDGRA